ncbi:LPXTG cell wall anchor domain-containing protein [Neobacillus sp. NPDC093127]|uniref:LPXTG cell wall anchor domain-containing protein n=1 Tax=Neobacillus sp. NPDC093127 TaxID=3364296 RepID=UPI00382CD9D5
MNINSNRYILLIIYCFLLLALVVNFPIGKTSAEPSPREIDIATSPEKVLFDLKNLKPGDWAERKLTILNRGKQDFKYLSSSSLKEGSDLFFEELLLTISDKDHILFDGKMKDFNKLTPRLIAKNNSEQLFFKVKVPETLGNEFQGLNCLVEFKFYVEGTLGGVLPVDGPKLPETGTNMFNILVAGAVLVLTGSILQFIIKRRRKLERRI